MVDIDPTSPESMRRTASGESGLSAIREKPVDNRSTWQQLREYLTTGINEDARYALGPHAAPAVKGISSLAAELTPAADTRDALVESQKTAEAVSEGKALEAGIGGLSTLASLAAMFVPGSLSGAKKVTEEAIRKSVDEPVTTAFTTAKGSTYKVGDGVTQRNKSLHEGHDPKDVGLKDQSKVTVYTDGSEKGSKRASDIASLVASDTPTQLIPVIIEGEIKGIRLVYASDYGPKKAGDMIVEMPVTTKPEVGKNPIEIFNDAGTRLHIGNPIIKVERKKGGSVIERNPYNYEPRAV